MEMEKRENEEEKDAFSPNPGDTGAAAPGTGPICPPAPPWSAWDYLYHVMVKPEQAFSMAAQEKPIRLAVAVVLITSVISLIVDLSLGNAGGLPDRLSSRLAGGAFEKMRASLSIVGFFFGIFFWFLRTGFYNLAGELMGGASNGKGLLVCLGLAHWPSILLAPLSLIGAYGPGGQVIEGLGRFALGLWTLFLEILAIRAALQLSSRRAVFLYFLLPLSVVLLTVIALILIAKLPALAPAALP
ncbi:hypothetical protein GTO89_09040 [Heliobacterium gestii]|uniref:Yip1 domain-containing protein n=1 Tax=Heliomicrobium gestii TaxID=2699 RepID=A0A845LC88_HELGE|nr:Yip1 family protein [Heliomicrobium gestii]MBM7866539.1 hypothetical protein [Heliomicrobium gestii]MZP43181.1 hypothetical protein [Heliomicrobium gestii]